jgi:TRAP-type C4-dicarboxylate transport system permease small subunit
LNEVVVSRLLDWTEEIALTGLLALIVIVTFADVLRRNTSALAARTDVAERHIETPLLRVQEFAPNLFVWLTWIGVSYAIRKGGHFRIVVLPERFIRRAGVYLHWLDAVICVGFLGCLACSGIQVVVYVDIASDAQTPLGYPAAVLDLAVPAGAALAIVRTIQQSVARAPSDGAGEGR